MRRTLPAYRARTAFSPGASGPVCHRSMSNAHNENRRTCTREPAFPVASSVQHRRVASPRWRRRVGSALSRGGGGDTMDGRSQTGRPHQHHGAAGQWIPSATDRKNDLGCRRRHRPSPVLWLTESLLDAGHSVLFFAGTRSVRFLPIALRSDCNVCQDGITPTACIAGFPVDKHQAILSTDDGSLGYRGTIVQAVQRSFEARREEGTSLVLYACGPEGMLRALAQWAATTDVECYLCTERTMACGMGTCQSCVIPLHCPGAPDGWDYRLCCTDGPVFQAKDILWTPPS